MGNREDHQRAHLRALEEETVPSPLEGLLTGTRLLGRRNRLTRPGTHRRVPVSVRRRHTSRYHPRPILDSIDTTPTFHNTLGTTVTRSIIPLTCGKRITVAPHQHTYSSARGMDPNHRCPSGKDSKENSHPYRRRKNTVTITTGTEDQRKRHTAQDMHCGIYSDSQGMGQALPALQELRCGQVLSE